MRNLKDKNYYIDLYDKMTIEDCRWREDEMKRIFFQEVGNYLKPGGRIYFGWAGFADIDTDLPFRLAKENGYVLKNTFKKPHREDFNFYVLEFERGE